MFPYNSSNVNVQIKGPDGGRPILPGNTDAPKPLAMNIKLPSSRNEDDGHKKTKSKPATLDMKVTNSLAAQFRKMQEVALKKITSNLPYETREAVTAVLHTAINVAEDAQRQVELSKVESNKLRAEIKGMKIQKEKVEKQFENQKEKIAGLEEEILALSDTVASRQKFFIRNKRAIAQLASTNRMLIDSLDALQDGTPSTEAYISRSRPTSPDDGTLPDINKKNSAGNLMNSHSSGNNLTLTISDHNDLTMDHSNHRRMTGHRDTGKGEGKNNKLRESLLRVAREHYKSMKLSEVLDAKVAEQRVALRHADERARTMLLELAELRSIDGRAGGLQSNAPGVPMSLNPNPVVEEMQASFVTSGAVKRINKIDERFKALLSRAAIDPLDGIAKIRSVVNHIAYAPTCMDVVESAVYFCNRDITNVFDVDIVEIFLLNKEGNQANKFTQRSSTCEVVSLHNTKSLVSEVIAVGRTARINNMNRMPSYNAEIDGVPGMITKKMLSVPLLNKGRDVVIGTMQLLNKRGNENFTEVDELYALMYADQVAAVIVACQNYNNLCNRSEILKSLLEASTSLFSAVPDPDSLAAHKVLQPEDIIFTIERIIKETLKCWSCRAFLLSDNIKLYDGGHFLLIDHIPAGAKSATGLNHRTVTSHSGLAGHCFQAKRMYETVDVQLDDYFNPHVDIDPTDAPMVTAPILNVKGEVLACIQVVGGGNAPPMEVDYNNPHAGHDDAILLGQATEWLAHQLATPLEYMLSYIGKAVQRPASTPSMMHSPSRTPRSLSKQGTRDTLDLVKSSLALTSGDSEIVSPPKIRRGTSEKDNIGAAARKEKHASIVEDHQQVEELKSRLHRALEDLSMHKRNTEAALTAEKERFVQAEGEVHHWRELYETASYQLEQQIAANKAHFSEQVEEDVLANARPLSHTKPRGHTPSSSHSHREHSSSRDHGHGHSINRDRDHSTSHHRDHQGHKHDKKSKWLEEQDGPSSGAVDIIGGDRTSPSSDVLTMLNEGNVVSRHEHEESLAALTKLHNSDLAVLKAKHDSLEELCSQQSEKLTESAQVNQTLKELHDAEKSEILAELAELKEQVASQRKEDQNTLDERERQRFKCEEAEGEIVRLKGVIKSIKKGDDSDEVTKMITSLSEEVMTLKSANAQKDELIAKLREELVKLTSESMSMSSVRQTNHAGDKATTHSGRVIISGRPPDSAPPKSSRSNASRPGSAGTTKCIRAPPTPQADIADVAPAGTGWSIAYDDQGHAYYYNADTGESSWEAPPGFPAIETTDPDSELEPVFIGDWLQQTDDQQNHYYVNQVTGESVWELPENAAQSITSPNGSVAAAIAAGNSSNVSGGYSIEL